MSRKINSNDFLIANTLAQIASVLHTKHTNASRRSTVRSVIMHRMTTKIASFEERRSVLATVGTAEMLIQVVVVSVGDEVKQAVIMGLIIKPVLIAPRIRIGTSHVDVIIKMVKITGLIMQVSMETKVAGMSTMYKTVGILITWKLKMKPTLLITKQTSPIYICD